MSMKNRLSLRSERSFQRVVFLILLVICIMVAAPIYLIIVSSFAEEKTLLATGYSFFPARWSLNAYAAIFRQSASILHAYWISVLVTAVGTTGNLLLTTLYAYPLSRKNFRYRNVFAFIVFFTMLFNGGIVPQYILYSRYLGIKNTLWALIVPNQLLGGFYIFLMRNYFSNTIPGELIEAAKIDGASETQVFIRIMLPLSTPVIATVGLFVGLGYWNDWINGLYYITSSRYFSLQLVLKRLLDNIQYLNSGRAATAVGSAYALPTTAYRMALAVIGIVPILAIFPFVQKYLVKGTVIGAIKG